MPVLNNMHPLIEEIGNITGNHQSKIVIGFEDNNMFLLMKTMQHALLRLLTD